MIKKAKYWENDHKPQDKRWPCYTSEVILEKQEWEILMIGMFA